MNFPISSLIALAVSFIVSVIFTFAVREFARRYGFVAKPKADRWHKRPTAMLGGLAVFLTVVAVSPFFIAYSYESAMILAGSGFLFLVGLLDDILNIKPYQKLIGQFIGVVIIIQSGLVMNWTDWEIVNIAITVFWIIGITNAINLLDNMDGLAAGISAVAAISLAFLFAAENQLIALSLISVFIGALLGFLVFNFNPASIFMGDCGSMFIGFFLAGSVLLAQEGGGRSRSIVFVLAVPALILFVPIFDTTFVTVLRKLWGRKASEGGRDHTSHRLVALGLSERAAVLMLYGFAAIAGVISFTIRSLTFTQSLALIAGFTIVLTIIGVYLAKVKVYEEQEEELALQNKAGYGFLLNLSHKRRIFEVFLDAILITLAYYGAYVLIFGSFENNPTWNIFIKSLPLVIVCQLFAFLVAGVYRGMWRYTGIRDSVTFAKGVALGSILSVLGILFLYRFQEFSRAVFVLNAVLLFLAVAGSRLTFRMFRQLIPAPVNTEGRRVLIYGAGDGGELVLRELHNNPEWNYNPVGFLDDDPLKKGKVIHGLRVFGGNGDLTDICKTNDVQEVLLSSRRFSNVRVKEIRELCNEVDVPLKRAMLQIEAVDFE